MQRKEIFSTAPHISFLIFFKGLMFLSSDVFVRELSAALSLAASIEQTENSQLAQITKSSDNICALEEIVQEDRTMIKRIRKYFFLFFFLTSHPVFR